MGRNIKGGKKHKKSKNKNNNEPLRTRELILPDDRQQIFTITKMLGNGRCLGNGSDGRSDVLCIIRGAMMKRIWIKVGDLVLGSYRDFSSGKNIADLIHKYSDEDALRLKQSHNFIINKNNETNSDTDIGFTFSDL